MNHDLYSSSESVLKSIERAAKRTIERGTQDCFRVYKATVIRPPYIDPDRGDVCDVRLSGDTTILTLPYSSDASAMRQNDTVWVATISNSFRNAIVWQTRYFQSDFIKNTKHYGVKWDKTLAQLTRTGDAENITTNTANFGYFGSVNGNYDNPFDSIYPWSGMKLCNIDIDLYQALPTGSSLVDCVVAWEDDADFSYTHQYGVWRYRPAFYGKSWEDSTYRYFDICPSYEAGYVYYPEAITGRWHGVSTTIQSNGSTKTCFLPTIGIADHGVLVADMHQKAKNYKATLDNIYSDSAEMMLYLVEYANMNSQNTIGFGASNMISQGSNLFTAPSTNSTQVRVAASAASKCQPNTVFNIGTSANGINLGYYKVVSTQADPNNSSVLVVTLDQEVSVTTSDYWSITGVANVSDTDLGSKTGYIGANGAANNVYYRGVVLYGNFYHYTLGFYVDRSTGNIWLAQSPEIADRYDDLNQSIHYNTGMISANTGWISGFYMPPTNLSFSMFPLIKSLGGNNQAPVGDQNTFSTGTGTCICYRGGSFGGTACGLFEIRPNLSSAYKYVSASARPILKNP